MDKSGNAAIAVITARGGSKRIPHKNIKMFCGKPILAYSLRAALECGEFDEVLVSTDSEKIAETAIRFGASVPFLRSTENSGDFATTTDVLLEVCVSYEKLRGPLESICCIYPTAPFVTPERLSQAMALLRIPDTESVLPVVRFDYPPQRGLLLENGAAHFWMPAFERARSQDLPPVYHDCGQFYCIKTAALKQYRSLVTPRCRAMKIPAAEAQDIDTPDDWKLAELKYRLFSKGADSCRD